MIWLLVFAAWLSAFFVLWRLSPQTTLRAIPLPVTAALVACAALWLPFGPLAGLIFAGWAWRIPKLVRDLRAAALRRARRQEAYSLIVLLASGISAGRPVYTTLRDALPKLPPLMRGAAQELVGARMFDASYDIGDALQKLGREWGLPELEVAGQVASLAAKRLGASAAEPFQRLTAAVRDRDRRRAELTKGLAEIVTTAKVFLAVAGGVLVLMLLVPSTRHMLLGTSVGRVVVALAMLWAVGALYLAEAIWRRQEAFAHAAV